MAVSPGAARGDPGRVRGAVGQQHVPLPGAAQLVEPGEAVGVDRGHAERLGPRPPPTRASADRSSPGSTAHTLVAPEPPSAAVSSATRSCPPPVPLQAPDHQGQPQDHHHRPEPGPPSSHRPNLTATRARFRTTGRPRRRERVPGRPAPAPTIWPVTATMMDGEALAAEIKADLADPGRGPGRPGHHARPGHRAGRRRRAERQLRRHEAPGLRRAGHDLGRPAPARRRHPGRRRGGGRRAQRRPRGRRLHHASTRSRRASTTRPPCCGVDPAKDADGLHPVNLGLLVMGVRRPAAPARPAASCACCTHYDVPVAGRHVVIVGRGLTIGRPLANLLTLKRPDANAAVTVVHTGVDDIGAYTRTADIVVAAAGSPGLITADMVRRVRRWSPRACQLRRQGCCPTSPTRWPRWPGGCRPASAGSAP